MENKLSGPVHPSGWWMASDGNYYPPELRPNYQAPPQVPQRFSPQGLPSSPLKGTKITIRPLGWHFPSAVVPALPRLTPVGTENPIRPAHAASRYW